MSQGRSFTSVEVCAAAACSYRQLDHWTRLGIIHPSVSSTPGSGHQRRWSTHDVSIVKVLTAVAGRLPLVKLGALVEFLDDLPLQQWAATSIVLDMNGDVWLSTTDAPKVGVHVDLSLVFDPVAA